jgi:hypothetical protein
MLVFSANFLVILLLAIVGLLKNYLFFWKYLDRLVEVVYTAIIQIYHKLFSFYKEIAKNDEWKKGHGNEIFCGYADFDA